MKNIGDSTKPCTGCGACAKACPFGAINYKKNRYGFYEAKVNKKKCTNCGLCQKVCAKFIEENEKGTLISLGILYSAQSEMKEVVESCTSGGIAYEIAKYGIENGYKIFGTIYNYKKDIAEAIIVDKNRDLELLKGSKYLQSKSDKAIIKLIEDCKKNKDSKYIVFGTPCQLLGVDKLIQLYKIKNEIIKVDLFCHGVPTYHVWEQYKNWLKNKKKIEKIEYINFRSKHRGWHDFCTEVNGNSKEYFGIRESDLFYKAFFDNILLNTACYNCVMRKQRASSDIRLGDFWGKRYQKREDGISATLCITNKGKKLIGQLVLLSKVKLISQEPIDSCLLYQASKDYKYQSLQYEALNKLVKKESLTKVIREYRKKLSKKQKIKNFAERIFGILPYCVKRKIKEIIK